MSNDKYISRIRKSWYGNFITGKSGVELMMFHLTDKATVIYTIKYLHHAPTSEYREKTEEMTILNFEKEFNLSISTLLILK